MTSFPTRRSCLTAGLALLALGATAPQTPPRSSPLFKDARQLMAVARAAGKADITLLVAAVPGEAAAAARRAETVGGDVRYRDDEVDYLRVRMPIDRVDAFARYDRIESVTVDYTELDGRRLTPTQGGAAPDTIWPPRWSDYPLRNPYRASAHIDAAAFLDGNPAYDGRGVTIALLDGHYDFLLPEFQVAHDLDGRPIPKLADVINATDPRDDADHIAQWVDMREEVVARGRRVTFQGREFTTPHDGAFRIGLFNERRFNNNADYLDQDVDRNGNPRGDDGLFGVLWDERTNDVWVDTNRDLSFADQEAMTDYIVRQDLGTFGTDDPATQVRESVGFTVQTDPHNKFISINVGVYQHATEIMGHVVGNASPNGRLTGVAPGARLVSVFYGVSNAHGLIEGLIAAFRHPLTDVVVLEQSVAIASMPYLLADGRHPISIVAQRLIDRYEKLLFVPGSNAPGLGIVAEDGLAPSAISVGGYQHRESYLINNGFEPTPDDNMHWGGLSHGPSGIGALKPDLLAPSGQMSVDIGYVYRQREQERRGLYQLPAGYFVDGGTSTAAPMAAGATALVISAAKQSGLAYDARRLRAAILGSARHIDRLHAHEQGNGLVQVEAAFELLKELQDPEPVVIVSRGPVRTRLGALLSDPNTGVGLYEREGWSVGDRGTRALTITRISGSRAPMTFALEWHGNDGTFRTESSVVLPLDQPVELPVHVSVSDHGPHSAILSLTHPSIPGYAHRILTTVIASLRPGPDNDHTVNAEIDLPRPGDRGLFVDVPPGTAALQFSAATEAKGDVRLLAISPGREMIYMVCPPNSPSGGPCTVAGPEPGVWEINVTMQDMVMEYDPGRERPLPPASVRVSAKALAVDVADSVFPTSIPLATGESVDLLIQLSLRGAATPVALAGTPLRSAHAATRSIAAGEQHVYEITVPEGASAIFARVSHVTDPDADLDLYLIDCTAAVRPDEPPPPEKDTGNKAPRSRGPDCTPQAKSATVAPGGELEVENPAPGRWVVVVDGYAVPAGSTGYRYLDAYAHPRLGTIAASDHEQPRSPGETWTTTAHVWVAAPPEPDRSLLARFVATSGDVRSGTGTPATLGALEVPLALDRAHTAVTRPLVEAATESKPIPETSASGQGRR